MLPGQVVSVDIEGIGTLTNPVVSAEPDEPPNEAEQ
jgi:2-keto-4-pentenoate hydratase/2-oxohepta-3-ene-1,7-dioic acid hydratase in catechol pathway